MSSAPPEITQRTSMPGVTDSGRLVITGPRGTPRQTTATTLDRAYDARRPLRTLLLLYDLRWWQHIGLYLLFLLKNLPVWTMPLAGFLMVAIIERPDLYSINQLVTVVAVMLGILLANIPTHMWYIHHVSQRNRGAEQRLRAALVRRLQQLSIRFHSETESGRIQAKVLSDVDRVEQLGQQLNQNGLQAATMVLFAFGVTLAREPWLALFYAVAAPMCVLLVSAFKNRMRDRQHGYRAEVESMSARVSEMIDMIPVTRAHGVEGSAIAMVDERLDLVRHEGRRLDNTNALFQSSTWVTLQVSQLLSLAVTATMCWYGMMEVADVFLYQALFAQIIGSVNLLLGMMPQLTRGFESVRSLGEVLECPDLEQNIGKAQVGRVEGEVQFEAVSFTYPGRGEPALRGLDFHARPGECIAFVGESGSGKSTAMNLTIGFLRPTGGRILLDGRDMAELDMRTWRRSVAVVSQNVLLFGGSLRENICYGLEAVDDAQLQAVIDAANLREVVANLPQGLETPLGENGVQLSGGQRQRIAIARALIRDPQIIILDEATSALDVVSERQVQEAIDRLVTGRTTFIVAHRLSTIRNADRVIVMKDGVCIESGSQDELMALGGEFHRLKTLQS